MLPFVQEEQNLTRRFNREDTLQQIEQIRRLREEGKSIPEIKIVIKNSTS